MAPKTDPKAKGKKKKKTKEELEEERRLAEEAARLAEEERRRLEEEERKRLEELERQRQELLGVHLGAEADRVNAEKSELESLLGQFALERSKAEEQQKQDWEWNRFLSCTYIPHPQDRVAMSDFIAMMQGVYDGVLTEAMTAAQDCYHLIDDCQLFRWKAHQRMDDDAETMFCKDVSTLHELVNTRIDRVTAHILHYADEHANDKGEVQLGLKQDDFQWAVWVNTSKNPRMKTVDMPQLQMVVEIPKQIALAPIAMRVQHRKGDEFFARCTNEFMAVGGVLYVDLLSLPPPSKKVKQWVLRQVTPLAYNVSRIPYPIPPAGADPLTYKSEEEPPPLGFTLPFTNDVVLPEGPLQVGWWDAKENAWSTQGVTDAAYDAGSETLSLHSTHIGPLAIIQSRARLLPYRMWSVRPTGGRNGATAAVTLDVGLAEPLVFEAGPGYVQLAAQAGTTWPQLEQLAGRRMQPAALLQALSRHGLHLLPEDRDAAYVGMSLKERAAEEALCADLGLLCGVFLISRARWNQAAKAEECIARISEVLDWEEGGRTEQRHLERIFSKEKEDGERRVLAVMQRSTRGVAFCDALDKREELPALPGHETVESVQACMDTVWGEVHANLMSLLKGPSLQTEALASGPLPARLQATPESLELVRTTNPLLTQVVGQLLALLRVFSFS
mmetsp:Transcript_31025/g.68839  ORF Transcript_31025/g.68839 Transcript_31025/m.68839 type:complete len:672 (-) Transcript_31025:511-2526(-)